jgi:hypothetical protein
MCGTVAPCGGDIRGNWNVIAGCITAAGVSRMEAESGCPSESLRFTAESKSGMLTFNADMSYSFAAFTEQLDYEVGLPGSCAPGLSCTQVAASFQASGSTSASCSGSGSCNCAVVELPNVDSETGTYAISGTRITTTNFGGSNVYDYCVDGMNLHLITTSATSLGSTGPGMIDDDAVAQRI